MRGEFGNNVGFVSITPGKLIIELAQVDTNLSPKEGAKWIIECWESGNLKSKNGIFQLPDVIIGR